jgi:hypothetical protein
VRTPRFDSPRRRDQLHLWALRTGRKVWRARPGAAARYRAEGQAKTVYVQRGRWEDGEFIEGEVVSFRVDGDTLALHQDVVACNLDGEVYARRYTTLLRIFSEDPTVVGYKAGTRPQDPPEHNWPTGPAQIPDDLRGVAEHREAQAAFRRRRRQRQVEVDVDPEFL